MPVQILESCRPPWPNKETAAINNVTGQGTYLNGTSVQATHFSFFRYCKEAVPTTRVELRRSHISPLQQNQPSSSIHLLIDAKTSTVRCQTVSIDRTKDNNTTAR